MVVSSQRHVRDGSTSDGFDSSTNVCFTRNTCRRSGHRRRSKCANRDVPALNSIIVLLDSETSPIVESSGGGLPHQASPHGIFGAKTATLRNPLYR
jgi:hypothetical protein